MIALLLTLAASADESAQPLLFDCIVSDANGARQPLVILDRNWKTPEIEVHDPASLLPFNGGGVFGTTYAWPSYWEHDVGPYFLRGPHEENLGTSGGWTIRVESVKGTKFEATIELSNFNTLSPSSERPSVPDFVLKGDCTWREGRSALTTYRRLTK